MTEEYLKRNRKGNKKARSRMLINAKRDETIYK
jgi:hypothetical protein